MKKLILILAFIFIACITTPKPVYRLEPDAEKSAWLQGLEFVHLENNSFDVIFAFDRVWDDNFVFDFEIANKSEHKVLISPEEFYYTQIQKRRLLRNKNIVVKSLLDSTNALDPELKILEMDLNQSRADASYKTHRNQLMGLTALDLIFDIATIGDPKTDLEEAEEEIDDLQRRLDIAENENEHEQKIQNINRVQNQWRDVALRKTTLKPGYSIQGKVYFPIKFDTRKGVQYSRNLLFYFPVGDTIFTQAYKQKTYSKIHRRKQKKNYGN